MIFPETRILFTFCIFIFLSVSGYAKDVNVLKAPYNAKGDGVTSDRPAIQRAIDDVSKAGGGSVILPGGHTYLTGSLFLKDNVTLEIQKGAIVEQSQKAEHYTKPVYYGLRMPEDHPAGGPGSKTLSFYYNYPLIYGGFGVKNITVTGGGTVLLSQGNSDEETLRTNALVFVEVDGFEVSNLQFRNPSVYSGPHFLKFYQCNNGKVDNIHVAANEIRMSEIKGVNDNLWLVGCQNIEVANSSFKSHDDAIVIGSLYFGKEMENLRRGEYFRYTKYQRSQNIDIHNCTIQGGPGQRGISFHVWSFDQPDPRTNEICDVRIHDNVIDGKLSISGRFDDWMNGGDGYALEMENGKGRYPMRSDGFSHTSVKNIRIWNNKLLAPAFFTPLVSDVNFFQNQTILHNSDFEYTGDAYWTLKMNKSDGSAGSESSQTNDETSWIGYIRDLDQGDARIYQGIYLDKETVYNFSATVRTSGDSVRLFVRNLDTQDLIAAKDMANTEWQTQSLKFFVPASANYHVGIEKGEAKKGWAEINEAQVMRDVLGSIVLQDDFQDKSTHNWEFTDDKWDIGTEGGGNRTFLSKPKRTKGLAITGSSDWQDVAISARMKVKFGRKMRLIARYQNPQNNYWFEYDNKEKILTIGKRINDEDVILQTKSKVLGTGWYTFQVTLEGKSIHFYVDNVLELYVKDPSLKKGKIGVSASSTLFVDDVKVIDLTKEPMEPLKPVTAKGMGKVL